MPRRKVRPPPEDAVASSPLFELSPEVRNMIYTNILVESDSHHAIFIPTDYFKRRKVEPAFQCEICRQGFSHSRQLVHHKSVYGKGEPCKPPTHKLPTFSTTLLRSCRLINTEAAPLLYCANAFYFNDPYTLHQFRWKTASYSKLITWVEEITLELSNGNSGRKDSVLWQNYLSGSESKTRTWRLSNDFPHLKRLTVVLTTNCLLYPPSRLRELCDIFGQNLTGLDWVHVIGLNDLDVVSFLKPMVCKTESSQSKEAQDNPLLAQLKTVQTHTTEYECASGWKNVTLWRGSHESRPPFVPSLTAGTERERKHLFRFETNGVETSEAMLNHDQLLHLQVKQNTTLVRMAKDQANHKPEDVALQQELADVRLDIVNQRILSQIVPSRPALSVSVAATQGSHALQDYQMQLMLLEHQNKHRHRMAGAGQVYAQTRFLLQDSRNQHREVESRLRMLEVWARHIGHSDPDLNKEISKAETLVRELQRRIDDAVVQYEVAAARREDLMAKTQVGILNGY